MNTISFNSFANLFILSQIVLHIQSVAVHSSNACVGKCPVLLDLRRSEISENRNRQ